MAGNVTKVTKDTFKSEVLEAEVPVLVDFWAEWCAPCKLLSPLVEELSEELDGQLKFTQLDVDEYPNLAMQFGIMSIPTLGIFRNGKLVDRLVGFKPKRVLKSELNHVLVRV